MTVRVWSYRHFAGAEDLSSALRRAAAAHGEHEVRIGAEDPDWHLDHPEKGAGTELPS
ncbi:hypothetical protein [Streptomyces parvulus]|uniref:hypothetical protein n=1 Tax=Streptomyces parvulus TaxID=146923 RepID=UPI003697C5ED